MSITGGCLCGAVRYTIEAEPIAARICWCRDCQFIGAGSATVNVFFPTDKVRIEGELADYQNLAASGNGMHRRFCGKCGTPVTTQSAARLHVVGVRAGTLDDPEIGKPGMTIWTSSAPSWASFDESLPREPRQPSSRDGKSGDPSRQGEAALKP